MKNYLKTKRLPGFTLIELIVVIFIIGIISSAVIIHTNDRNYFKECEKFAEVLNSRINIIREQSIADMQILALMVDETHYEFFQYSENTNGKWIPLRLVDSFWQKYNIPPTIQMQVVTTAKSMPNDADSTSKKQTIIFYPDSENTAFTLTISTPYSPRKIQIIGYLDGHTILQEIT